MLSSMYWELPPSVKKYAQNVTFPTPFANDLWDDWIKFIFWQHIVTVKPVTRHLSMSKLNLLWHKLYFTLQCVRNEWAPVMQGHTECLLVTGLCVPSKGSSMSIKENKLSNRFWEIKLSHRNGWQRSPSMRVVKWQHTREDHCNPCFYSKMITWFLYVMNQTNLRIFLLPAYIGSIYIYPISGPLWYQITYQKW